VGLLGLVDPGVVEISELDGQFLHFAFDVGHNKAERAAAKLGAFNPSVQVEPYPALLDRQNAEAVVTGHDLVVDCSNSPSTRYLLNDACLALEVPLVVGGARAWSGLVMAVRPGSSACYSCAYPQDPEVADPTGKGKVHAPVAGLVGSIQALEAIKLLTGTGEPLLDQVLRLDGSVPSVQIRPVSRRYDCASCAG
jgi:adenylyltransferase/sulfurtransferase